MKRTGTIALGVMAALAGSAAVSAVTPEPLATPYEGIVDRNAFGLKPPPAPPDPEAAKPPPVKITLTGITTILGNKRALMKTPPPPGKTGEPSKGDQSYILTIGQREGDIEVLDIDEKAGSVKVNNAGAVVTLTFEKDGAKLPATTAPPIGGMPGVPAVPGGLPAPGGVGVPAYNGGGNPGFSVPTRTLRTTPTPGVVNPAGGAAGGVPGLPNYAGGQNRAQQITEQIASQQQSGMSPEQQMLMLEAQREMNRNNPKFPPLPPTPLSPGANLEGANPASPMIPRPPGLPPLPQ